MSDRSKRDNSSQRIEFSPEKDKFLKARSKSTNRWILAHILSGKNKYLFIFVFFITILSAVLTAQTYIYLGLAITDFTSKKTDTLLFYVLLILILSVVAPLLRLVSFMIREVIAQRMERDTRQEFLANLLGKSQSFHEQHKTGDIMSRATEDVRMLNFLMSPGISLIFESFTALIIPIIFIILFFPIELAITPILFTILFLIALKNYIKKLGPVSVELRTQLGLMNDSLNENLSGIELIKSTAQESNASLKYLFHAKKYRDAYFEEGKIQGKYVPLLLFAVAITVGLAHSIFLYYQGILTVGQIIAYMGLFALLRFPTNISIFIFAIVRLAHASSDRLLEIMNKETEIDENAEGIKRVINGKIKFTNVSFKYPDDTTPTLRNVSFEIAPGQTLAIVGTTGSGKTTLTKLISRLYDVNEGTITIDDIDIRKYSLQSLRSQISYIEQDVFLFSTSIFENISFGRASSLEQVVEVAKQAQVDDFVSKLPKEYETEVGERGVQLSGGERQRIAIARAFLANPKILILDDSTSAIDSETEDKIQKAISNILKNRTTILITHRLSQIRWADLIIVLKNGTIEAIGSHEDLLKTSVEYQKIFIKRFDIDLKQLLEVT